MHLTFIIVMLIDFRHQRNTRTAALLFSRIDRTQLCQSKPVFVARLTQLDHKSLLTNAVNRSNWHNKLMILTTYVQYCDYSFSINFWTTYLWKWTASHWLSCSRSSSEYWIDKFFLSTPNVFIAWNSMIYYIWLKAKTGNLQQQRTTGRLQCCILDCLQSEKLM